MSFPTHNILITAPGGNIGSHLVPTLLSHPSAVSFKLILPTSNPTRLRSTLPPTSTPSNTIIAEGSLKNPQWLEHLLRTHAISTVFLNLTGIDEHLVALNTLDGMRRAGCVKHLVYVSAFLDALNVKKMMREHSAMHILVKTAIEQKIVYGGYEEWTKVRLGPALFFTNDLRSKTAMLEEGLFDEPIPEAGLSRTSLTDIADVATAVIIDPAKWDGQKIMIGSKHQYTGSETAALWSTALGRSKPVKVVGLGKEFEERFARKWETARGMGEVEARMFARDMGLMFRDFGEMGGVGLGEREYEVLKSVLGREAESYEEWVGQVGRGLVV